MTRLVIWLVIVLLAALVSPAQAGNSGCHSIPVTWYSPTGIAGCVVYGDGIASTWAGPGAARNDCVWPWTACQPVSVTSLDTGRVIVVTPTMYGDLYTTTPDERIIDLDPGMVRALGLDPARGLWRVRVQPVGLISDTAMR